MPDHAVETRNRPAEASLAAPERRKTAWERWRGQMPPLTVSALWAFVGALFIVYVALQPNVLALSELGTIGIGALVLSTVAVGQTIVILTAGIDLSVGGMMSFGSALMATQMHTSSIVSWTLAVLAIGAILGAVNGLIITAFAMQPFIVTLATWSILAGAALVILPTAGQLVPTQFAGFIYGGVFGVPIPLVLMIALAAAWLWLKRTRVLRRVYAIGSDEEAAFLSGIPVKRTKVLAYALSGLLAMAAAIVYTMQTSSGDPTSGDPFILTSVAAVVIGGTSLFGGRGGAGGTIAGALILTLIADVMFAVGVSQFWTPLVQGALMILAVLGGAAATRRTRRLERGL